jgi:hypothetical protein
MDLDTSFLQQQRQRESSAGEFDHSREDPVIVGIIADRFCYKLCQLEASRLPSRLMTPDELYYMAKDPHLWPWQRTAVLTPTPPDTPTSASDMEMEELSSHCIVEGESKEEAKASLQSPSIETPSSSYKKEPNTKRTSGGIRKGVPARKHSMITLSLTQRGQNANTRDQAPGSRPRKLGIIGTKETIGVDAAFKCNYPRLLPAIGSTGSFLRTCQF